MTQVIAFLRRIATRDITGTTYTYYCGYVGVKDASSLPNSYMNDIAVWDDYDNSLNAKISVHGGITYDNTFRKNISIIPLTDIPADWYKYRCIGFDMNHLDDELIRNNYDFAKTETMKLKEQIEKLLV